MIRTMRHSAIRKLRRGFSLAEMMIALVILGLGLLFIAAALPAGVKYARETVERSAGEAAADHALDLIRLHVRTSRELTQRKPIPAGQQFVRRDNLFRPRLSPTNPLVDPNSGYPFDPNGEPFVKVRPLIGLNVDLTPGSQTRLMQTPDQGESLLRSTAFGSVLTALALVPSPAAAAKQVDVQPFAAVDLSLTATPGFPAVDRVYPPIPADFAFLALPTATGPEAYFADKYRPRPVFADPLGKDAIPGNEGWETVKASEQRVVWTALYRRAAYDKAVPDPAAPNGFRIERNDPLLYEFITIACRRPSQNHRFARQDAGSGGGIATFERPDALPPNATLAAEVLCPEPWLVSFTGWDPDVPVGSASGTGYFFDPATNDRLLAQGHRPTPVIRLTCDAKVGRLLPVGSVIIPAANDVHVYGFSPGPMLYERNVGFVPHAPDALPIYEVIERPDDTTVVVKGNGFYPWVSPLLADKRLWLCWVIPPAHTQRDKNGDPVFEKRSPILSVARSIVRVPEIP